MKTVLTRGLMLAMVCTSAISIAQNGTTPPSLPQIRSADGKLLARAQPVQCVNNAGNEVSCGGTGGGGGGTSDATAANQSTQIAAEQEIRDRIGAITSPAAGSLNQRLQLITSTLGSPFQAGGSIGNTQFGATQVGTWTVGVSGTVPVSGTFWQSVQPVSGPLTDAQLRASAVPVTGTFYQATQPISAASLPLPAGAATAAKQDATITALGSPFQAGGSIGNAFFGARLQDAGGAAFGTSGNPVFTTSNSTTSGAPGATAPANIVSIGGQSSDGVSRRLLTTTSGQALVASDTVNAETVRIDTPPMVYSIATTGTSQVVMPSTPTKGYLSGQIVPTSLQTGVGNVSVQQSFDQVTWANTLHFDPSNVSSTGSSAGLNNTLLFNITAPYIRVIANGTSTAGTTAVIIALKTQTLRQDVRVGNTVSVTPTANSNIATGQVSVGTSPTLVAAGRFGRVSVQIIVGAANSCAIGNSGVTLTTGYLLPAVAGTTDTTPFSGAVYAVCSATTTISYKEVY